MVTRSVRLLAVAAVLGGTLAVVLSASGQTGSGQARWVATDLGSSSRAVAINEQGMVAGEDFFWSKGTMIKLRTLGGWRVTARAVNGRGQVVGESVTGKDAPMPHKPHAFVWQNGRVVDLTPAAHPDARAFAINDRGQIVGYEGTGIKDKDGHHIKAGFLWQAGKLMDLRSLPSATDSTAYAINGRGQIVGWSGDHAVSWQSDTRTDLGTLPGDHSSRALAINGRGQIVGWSRKTWSGDPHGVLWSAGKIIDLGRGEAVAINERGQIMGNGYLWENGYRTSLNSVAYPSAINDRGQVVGQSYGDSAVVWESGHVTVLPGLGRKGSWALDINNHNQIVGWATTKSGKQHAVLWTLKR